MGSPNWEPMSKLTAPKLLELKKRRQKIVALTTYDFTTTRLLNAAGVDVLLVGDSLGMVKLGYESTLPVTVEDIVYHTRLVARAGGEAMLVADMPYMSYHASTADAVRNAGAMLKAGAQAVKVEGGREMLPIIRALINAKVPVMGHLGMTPQSVHVLGGYKIQGRRPAQVKALVAEAKALEKAGVFAIVLECLPTKAGAQISRALRIPTIGIGAGAGCDGQILVIDDLLGLSPKPWPRFVKAYADLRGTITRAARQYAREVREGHFPDAEHGYSA